MEKKDIASLPDASTQTQAALAPLAHAPNTAQQGKTDAELLTAIKSKSEQKTGDLGFNLYNFLGLHWVGNSALSLWITYNIMTKPGVAEGMHKMAKVLTPVAEGFSKMAAAIGINGKALAKEEQALKVTKLARSWTEVACMCIAGSIILIPVKLSEDYRQWFVDKIEGVFHPGKKKQLETLKAEAKERGLELPPEKPEHHETWTNLIRARVLALFPIFGIDLLMEKWNLGRAEAGKANFDTVEWGMGKNAYEKMNPSWREGLVKFFSSKGIKLSGIQYLMRDHLLDFMGSPQALKDISKEMQEIQHHAALYPSETAKIAQGAARIAELEGQIVAKGLMKSAEKVIFAEQARMLSKEVSLTLMYTGFLFILGKTPIVPWVMKKLGISKETEHKIEDAIEADVGLNVLPFNDKPLPKEEAKPQKKSFAERVPAKSPAKPMDNYQARITDEMLAKDARMWDRASS